MKKISFWDYKVEYKILKKKIFKKIDSTLNKKNIFFGDTLKEFEIKFLKINNSKFGLTVKSGTDAIILALMCCDIKKDDEVITTPFTAIPTISAIVTAGAKPVFVDINDDGLLNVDLIEKKITNKTKAIIPVHLYGKSCEMTKILKLKKKYNLKIIEDCAQSFLSRYKKKNVGNFGDFGCFSFYPTKILGTYGDGGFIICKNKKDLSKIKKLRFYGLETSNAQNKYYNKYFATIHGINSRMDNIQASILSIKLKYIRNWIKKRRYLAKRYFDSGKINGKFDPNHVYHLFTIKNKNRKKFIIKLNKNNVEYGIHYSNPIHKMKPYKKFVCNNCNCLKNSEKLSKETITLPLYPYLKLKDQDKVIKLL